MNIHVTFEHELMKQLNLINQMERKTRKHVKGSVFFSVVVSSWTLSNFQILMILFSRKTYFVVFSCTKTLYSVSHRNI